MRGPLQLWHAPCSAQGVQSQDAGLSPPRSSRLAAVYRKAFAWTVKPVGFVAGLIASLWPGRTGRRKDEANAKPVRVTRREEKQRRKELTRSAKGSGRKRRAA